MSVEQEMTLITGQRVVLTTAQPWHLPECTGMASRPQCPFLILEPGYSGASRMSGSSETGMSGNFGGRIKGAKYRFVLQDGTWDFS